MKGESILSEPMYITIKNQLLKVISQMHPNEMILSERELVKHFDASRMTVRKAVNLLVEEGVLYRDANRGTFVSDSAVAGKGQMVLSGTENYQFQVIYFALKYQPDHHVDHRIIRKLKLEMETSILRVVRMVKKGDTVIGIQEGYMSEKYVQNHEFSDVDTLFDIEKLLQVSVLEQNFEAVIVPAQYANLLAVPIQTPIIKSEGLMSHLDGRPFLYLVEYHHPKYSQLSLITRPQVSQ